MTPELKPCQHCGGEAVIGRLDSSDERTGYRGVSYVNCTSCGAAIKAADKADVNGWAIDGAESEATHRAIAAWNRRADLCQPKVKPTTDLIKRANDAISFVESEGFYDHAQTIRDLIVALKAAPTAEQLRGWAVEIERGKWNPDMAADVLRAAADRMEGK